MNSILFASEDSPVKSVIAADCARSIDSTSLQVAVAAGQQDFNDAAAIKAIEQLGIAWPTEILALDAVNVSTYDLVVCFADKNKTIFPVLPGNPAVVFWHVPNISSAEPGQPYLTVYIELHDQIRRLVKDLLGQGYLTALVQARKNAELLMDNLHEGIIAHDLNRRIFFFNQAAERITGYSRKEIIGRDCHDVFPERFCKSNCSFCDTSEKPSLPDRPYPLVFKTKANESRQIEMSVVAIKNFLGDPVGIVASFRDLSREYELSNRLDETEKFAGILGRDPKMQEIFRNIKELANSKASVLLQGESGTGKELVAAAIHSEGERASKLFVPVNCGALPENLLESELFGHVKGAFTGAIRDKKGRFELADNGTIFLDEIGDITLAMQVKLLRVLQDGTFQRVGGEETVKVDVRVISATHKDLKEEINSGRFREDLYYRLCVVPVYLPSLRERPDDIPLLARHFLKSTLAEENRPEAILSPDAMAILRSYAWPGNVRELQNTIRYILVQCQDDLIKPHHLPPNIRQEHTRSVHVKTLSKQRRNKLSLETIQLAFAATRGNRVKAARHLGVSRATLYRFLSKHSID